MPKFTAEEYRRFAKNCMHWSDQMRDQEARDSLRAMAKRFMRAALAIEMADKHDANPVGTSRPHPPDLLWPGSQHHPRPKEQD